MKVVFYGNVLYEGEYAKEEYERIKKDMMDCIMRIHDSIPNTIRC